MSQKRAELNYIRLYKSDIFVQKFEENWRKKKIRNHAGYDGVTLWSKSFVNVEILKKIEISAD